MRAKQREREREKKRERGGGGVYELSHDGVGSVGAPIAKNPEHVLGF